MFIRVGLYDYAQGGYEAFASQVLVVQQCGAIFFGNRKNPKHVSDDRSIGRSAVLCQVMLLVSL